MLNRLLIPVLILVSFISGIIPNTSNISANTSCSTDLASRLENTQWAKTTSGLPKNVRLTPGRLGEVVGQIPENKLVQIFDGPICVENTNWWKIAYETVALRGWIAEAVGNQYLLEPIDEASSTSYREFLRMGQGTLDTIAWRPDGKALLVGGSRGVTYYSDQLDLTGSWYIGDDVFSLAWNPDNRHFASAGGIYSHDWADGTLHVWDTFTGKVVHTLLGDTRYPEVPISSQEVALGWDPTGTQLLSIGIGSWFESGVRVWDTAARRLLREIPSSSSHDDTFDLRQIKPIALNWYRGELLLNECKAPYRGSCIWNIATGQQMGILESSYEFPFVTPNSDALSAAWSPDSSRILGVGINAETNNYILQTWDAATRRLLLTIPTQVNADLHTDYNEKPHSRFWVVWSKDSQHLISVSADASVKIWNANTGKLVKTFVLQGQTAPLQTVSWQPDQDKLATSDHNDVLRVWDAHTGELLATRYDHAGGSMIFANWSPDGNRIVTVTQIESVYVEGSRIHIWNANTGAAEVSIDSGSITEAFWSADGTKIFSGTIELPHRVWDTSTGELLHTFDETADLWKFLNESPDSRTINARIRFREINDAGLAILGDRGVEQLYSDPSALQEGGPNWMVVNNNGSRLAAVLHPYSSNIEILNTATFERMGEFGHNHVGFENTEIRWLEWSPDGKRLLSVGLDGTLRIWVH